MGYDGRMVAYPKDKTNLEYVLQDPNRGFVEIKRPSYYEGSKFFDSESIILLDIIKDYYIQKYPNLKDYEDWSCCYLKITEDLAKILLEKAQDIDDYSILTKEDRQIIETISECINGSYDVYFSYD